MVLIMYGVRFCISSDILVFTTFNITITFDILFDQLITHEVIEFHEN